MYMVVMMCRLMHDIYSYVGAQGCVNHASTVQQVV